MSGPDELLRLDYGETTQVVRLLTDIRFKLLALVPSLAGTGVAVLSMQSSPAARFTVGLVGLAATLGIFVYELRNTQLYDAAVHRAKFLEQRLAFPSAAGGVSGGVYSERPRRTVRLLGVMLVWHDRGLALVYGAAVAGWAYLVGWGGLALVQAGHTRAWGAAIGVAAGLAAIVQVERVEIRPEKAGAPAGDSAPALSPK
jgi:hypothetical protein